MTGPLGLGLRPPSLGRFVATAVLVPLLLIAFVGWLHAEYRHSELIREDSASSFDRRVGQITLLSRLGDVESAQQGYLLNGDPTFLDSYESTRRDIRAQLAAAWARHDPAVSRDYLRTVDRLVGRKLDELDRTIALKRAGDTAGVLRLVNEGSGKRSMDALRTVIGHMIAAEENRSARIRDEYLIQRGWQQHVVYTAVNVLVGLLFAFLVLSWRLRNQRHRLLLNAFESAERHATILDSTIDTILILNPSGTVESANAAATRMLGYTSAELERRDIAAILDIAPGKGSFHQRIGLVDGQLRRSFLTDRTIRHSDGRQLAVDIALGVMKLPSGDRLVVSVRDITERKRVERMKDDLVSSVSHELRTPLTSIVGSLGLLRAGRAGSLPAAAERLVDIAENNSRRLIRLINDMLDIDRIELGKLELVREPVDLRTVLEQVCRGSLGLTVAHDISLDCQAPSEPVIVSGDTDRLLQVVTNLVSNAIRAAPDGSVVGLHLETVSGRAIVSVSDRGAGIPHAFRDRIFGRFERAHDDRAATGTGLGLAISREIVARHHGTIWFEDREDGGTRFLFSLPLTDEQEDNAALAVLICADDDELARDLTAMVTGEGCAHRRVRTADEAHRELATCSCAAMLVDLSSAGNIGFEFAGDVPDTAATIAVVAVSGGTEGRTVLEVVDRIGRDHSPERVPHALRIALARALPHCPVVLHVDDDRELLSVVAAAVEPEVQMIGVTDLSSARKVLERSPVDLVIMDVELADGSGLDLLPSLRTSGAGIASIIYSAQGISADTAALVDAVLFKAGGTIPGLKAAVRRLVRARAVTL